MNEKPYIIMDSEIACALGVNEAIVIGKISAWLASNEKDGKNFYDGRYWTFNSFEEWKRKDFPFWSIRTIKRIFKKLEDLGVLVVGNYNRMVLDKTKWYSIDYETLDELCKTQNCQMDSSSRLCQVDTMVVSDWHYGECQVDTDNTKVYTNNNTKESYNVNGVSPNPFVSHADDRFADFQGKEKEILHNGNDFNVGIIRKEVITACRNYGVTDAHDIENALCVVEYYLESFKNVFMENHPFISQNAMNGVIERFFGGSDIVECDPEIYFALIDKHFATFYEDCDYNICHFMTDGIRQNRAYELGITA